MHLDEIVQWNRSMRFFLKQGMIFLSNNSKHCYLRMISFVMTPLISHISADDHFMMHFPLWWLPWVASCLLNILSWCLLSVQRLVWNYRATDLGWKLQHPPHKMFYSYIQKLSQIMLLNPFLSLLFCLPHVNLSSLTWMLELSHILLNWSHILLNG